MLHSYLRKRLCAERLERRQLLAVLFNFDADDPVRVLVPSQADYDDIGLDWTGGNEPFDASSWTASAGAPNGVGYDRTPADGDYNSLIGVDLDPSMFGQATTALLRAEFNVADPAAVERLTLNLRYDDGFIAWLNGIEVGRANTPAGYPARGAVAAADRQASLAGYDSLDISSSRTALHAGSNVLAIRGLNHSLSSDDFLIQFALLGESPTVAPTAVNDQATTQEATAITIDVLANDESGGDPINLASVVIATQPQHGTAVANPDGTVVYTPAAGYSGPDSFAYTVRDNSGSGVVTNPTLIASNGPVRVLVPSNGFIGTSWRGAIQNEPFDDSSWTAGNWGVGYDTNPNPINYNPFIATNVRTAMQNVNTTVYMRSTFNITNPSDVSALGLRMRYDDGFAAFINGVRVASPFAPQNLTWNSATLPGEGQSNGDGNAINFQTFNLNAAISALRPGVNILAIHGLNQTRQSSDLLMQPELTATITERGRLSNVATVQIDVTSTDLPPVVQDDNYSVVEGESLAVIIPSGGGDVPAVQTGATWKYYDSGSLPPQDALGNTWKDDEYDDTAWQRGPSQLGYGDNDEATTVNCGPDAPRCRNSNFITTWFRHDFTIEPGRAQFATQLTVELLRDDGASIYLNGVEIVRDNLPGYVGDGFIDEFTRAVNVVNVDEGIIYSFFVNLAEPRYANLLHDGQNTLAAEVHQVLDTSSDISFDLRMNVTLVAPVGVLSNDTEPDGQPMTASLVQNVQHGSLDLQPDGTFTYEPDTDFSGIDAFTYRASDGMSLSAEATATITVVHAPPTANPDSYSTQEDTTLVVDVASGPLANDTDTQGHALTLYQLVRYPSFGYINLGYDGVGYDGSFTYYPYANFHGTDSFEYTAYDGLGISAPATVTISIDPIPDAPVAHDDYYYGTEDQILVVDGRVGPTTDSNSFLYPQYVGGFYSVSSSQIEFSSAHNLLVLREGTTRIHVVDGINGRTLSEWTATEAFTDIDLTPDGQFLYVADYGTPLRPSWVHRFDLTDGTWQTKQAPEIAYRIEAVDADRFLLLEQSQWVDLTLNHFGAAAGDPITILSTAGSLREGDIKYDHHFGRVLHGNSNSSSNEITAYQLSGNVLTFIDSTGVYGTAQGHAGPVAMSADGNYFFYGDLQVDAANVRNNLFVYPTEVWASAGNMAFLADGSIFNALSGQQLASLGSGPDAYAVSDKHLWVLVGVVSYSFVYHLLLPIYGFGVLAYDETPDGGLLTATLVDGPTNGTLDFAESGTFTYTPDAGYIGPDSFTYRASDGLRDSNVATVNLFVQHQPPTANEDTYEVAEDTALSVSAAQGLLLNDTDTQNYSLYSNLNNIPLHGIVSLSLDGSFRYTPAPDFAGTDSFWYYAYENVTGTYSEPALVTIAVTPVNDAPVAQRDVYSVNAGQTLDILGGIPSDGYVGAVMASAPVAYWRLGESGGTIAADELGAHPGTYTGGVTPGAQGWHIDDTAARFDSDGNSVVVADDAALNPAALSVEAVVYAEPGIYYFDTVVTKTTDSSWTDGYGLYMQYSSIAFFVNYYWNAVQAPLPIGEWTHVAGSYDGLNLRLYLNGVEVAAAAYETTINHSTSPLRIGEGEGSPSYSWVGKLDEVALYNRALSGLEVAQHYAAGVGANAPHEESLISRGAPWAYRDNIANGDPYPIDAEGDLWTESDYDGNAWPVGAAPLGYGTINAAPLATVINYGPNEFDKYRTALFRRQFTAIDAANVRLLSFDALIDDGAVIYINGREVSRVNMYGGPVDTNWLSVYDGNEDAYQPFAVDLAPYPGLLVEGNNWIAVEVHQTDGTSSDLGWDLALSALIMPPPPELGVLDNDIDLEANPLTAAPVAGPYRGTVVLDPDGGFRYTPQAGFSGVDQFTYRANDALLDSTPALVTINVGGINVAPSAFDDRYVAWGYSLYVPFTEGVLANDYDLNFDNLSVTIEEHPYSGVLYYLYPDGQFYYIPEEGFSGTDIFEYRVSDGTTSVVATATIEVLAHRRDPINAIPRPTDDTYTVGPQMFVTAAETGVMSNDSDAEGDAINAMLVSAPWHGTLRFSANGAFSYTPLAGFTGSDRFTYRMTDGNTFSEPATVTIQVESPPEPTPPHIVGDLDRDGGIDRTDLRWAMRLVGQTLGSARYDAAADLDGDGRISLGDIVALRNLAARELTALSPGASVAPAPRLALASNRVATRGRLHAVAVDSALEHVLETAATGTQRRWRGE